MIYHQLMYVFLLFPVFLHAQAVDELIDHVYQREIQLQNEREKMRDYVFRQAVHFTKMDGDGEVEEQSKRIFQVYVRPPDLTKRILISAKNYEDGRWIDVTRDERKKNRKTESQKFSLLEMVAPDVRENYMFNMIEKIISDSMIIYRIGIKAKEKNEEYFDGELWIEGEEYSLTKAILTPSDLPTGLESMVMSFRIHPLNGYWLPKNVLLEAHISFLFLFKGQIKTEIQFNDYKLDQTIPDSVFLD
jgi:hypothetical protein